MQKIIVLMIVLFPSFRVIESLLSYLRFFSQAIDKSDLDTFQSFVSHKIASEPAVVSNNSEESIQKESTIATMEVVDILLVE